MKDQEIQRRADIMLSVDAPPNWVMNMHDAEQLGMPKKRVDKFVGNFVYFFSHYKENQCHEW